MAHSLPCSPAPFTLAYMANWPFSSHHDELRASIRAFVETELAPHADEWEEQGDFPDWVFTRMGELGFLGLAYPEEYGGGGGDYLCQHRPRRGDDSLQLGRVSRWRSPCRPTWPFPRCYKFGTEEQKQRYLVPAIKGEKIFCLGITEPDAGSDVAGIKTTAKKVDGGWVINGRKIFITNGRRAHAMTLVAKTDTRAAITASLCSSSTPTRRATR